MAAELLRAATSQSLLFQERIGISEESGKCGPLRQLLTRLGHNRCWLVTIWCQNINHQRIPPSGSFLFLLQLNGFFRKNWLSDFQTATEGRPDDGTLVTGNAAALETKYKDAAISRIVRRLPRRHHRRRYAQQSISYTQRNSEKTQDWSINRDSSPVILRPGYRHPTVFWKPIWNQSVISRLLVGFHRVQPLILTIRFKVQKDSTEKWIRGRFFCKSDEPLDEWTHQTKQ